MEVNKVKRHVRDRYIVSPTKRTSRAFLSSSTLTYIKPQTTNMNFVIIKLPQKVSPDFGGFAILL